MAIQDYDNGLRKLSRHDLQQLAKLHKVKANLKSEAIIRQLIQKGVKIGNADPQGLVLQHLPAEPTSGSMYPGSPPPDMEQTASIPNRPVSATQFLSDINMEVQKRLSYVSPEPSSPVAGLPPSLQPHWGDSVSNRYEPTNVQKLDDSMELEDYEDVMTDYNTQNSIGPPAHHRPQSAAYDAQCFAPPSIQVGRQLEPPTQSAAEASRPRYTPNGKHVYTDDPKQPIRPRVFYQKHDQNRPSACHTQRPPTRKTARRYLRECLSYISEQEELHGQLQDIQDIQAVAKQKLSASERRLARIQKARVAIEKHWMRMLKADPRLHDGSWSWTRPETAEQEAAPPPPGPPEWRADDYSTDLDSPDDDFEIAEEVEGRREKKYKGLRRSKTQAAHFEDAVARFEAWTSLI